MFSLIVGPMAKPRQLQFCGFVAQQATDQAGEAADPALRTARLLAARKMQSRLATDLAKANAGLSPEQINAIAGENSQAMGLLSYAPSPQLAAQIRSGNESDIIGLFIGDIVRQCDAMLDARGVATASSTVDLSPPAKIGFKWRGKTAAEAFAGTGLVPWAERICGDGPAAPADYSGAKLGERGVDGVSLLDWAIECRDRAAFTALLDAGFDTAKPGQFGDPPLVVAVEGKDPWYVTELLRHGASPDAMGHWRTALSAAYEPLEDGGGEMYRLLRKADASLNFPAPQKSMWNTWTSFARWEMILSNWDSFKGDPVLLGRDVTMELEHPVTRGSKRALETLKARLASDFGVCFPVVSLLDLPRDAQGNYRQPGCPGLRPATLPSGPSPN